MGWGRVAGCLALIVGLVAACGGGHKAASPTTATPATGGSSSPAGASATAPTASSGPVTSPPAGAPAGASSDPVAVALNGTLLRATETERALSLPAAPSQEPTRGGTTPQGPLAEQGLLQVLPDASVYKPIYEQAGGGVGANVTYHAATPRLDIDIAALKFATTAGAEAFITRATALATTFAQGRTTPHPELGLGVASSSQQVVLRVPPSSVGDPVNETVLLDVVESNGVTYLLTLLGPPGTISDQQIIALARAQQAKWTAARPGLHLG